MSKATIPLIDDFIMQLLGMSEAQYGGEWIIGWSSYNDQRPAEWPTAFSVLRHYGFPVSNKGWEEFIQTLVWKPVVTTQALRKMQGEQRCARQWVPVLKVAPDYARRNNEEYEALFPTGLNVCQGTYQKTGRMILR